MGAFAKEGIEGVVLTHVPARACGTLSTGARMEADQIRCFYLEAIQTLSSVDDPQNVLIGLGTASVLEAA